MIKSERQLAITKKKIEKLKENVRHIEKKYAGNEKKIKFFSKGIFEHIELLTKKIVEYDRIRYGVVPKKLHANNLLDIRNQIIKLRIAKGITQVALASKLSVAQSEISRFERDDYEGYSIKMLEKILEALDTDVEIDLIPVRN